MKVATLALVLVVVVVASSALTYHLIVPTVHEETLDLQVKVDTVFGFNVDTDRLYFGSMQNGGGGFRFVTLTNGGDAQKFSTSLDGPIASWVRVDPPEGMLAAGETRNLTVSIAIPMDAPQGIVEGQLHIRVFP